MSECRFGPSESRRFGTRMSSRSMVATLRPRRCGFEGRIRILEVERQTSDRNRGRLNLSAQRMLEGLGGHLGSRRPGRTDYCPRSAPSIPDRFEPLVSATSSPIEAPRQPRTVFDMAGTGSGIPAILHLHFRHDGDRFSWREDKTRSNQREHRISFDVAARVFLDPLHVTRQDRIEDDGADPPVATIHIIPARKADRSGRTRHDTQSD